MDISQIGVRILLSIIIGGFIGYNREYENRPAGFRTHVLVCLGATIAALIQVQLIYFASDELAKNPALSGILKVNVGRVICQVISGVGFLGAGAIIQTKWAVKGLTTAASMWAVACVGLAIGMGFYKISILSGVSILIVLTCLKKFEDKFIDKTKIVNFKIKCLNDKAIEEINSYFEDYQIKIDDVESKCDGEYIYTLEVPHFITSNEIISGLIGNKNINRIREIKNK
ncbi:MgtC/SapB family protein [Clostridium sp. LIBA-8841]|uniref:MgtC/SapB family protein n=1 Tax=Clostridium sp. LIBA-8841 TaxID=2987530 RepID=UPI002AC526C1|nr:MgtC/SapB family protein [Clostridium sp. LIBA-8841]MDZ5253514.1 MgtC/SapB family protein [Clostridium sp. LIBA-8841]